MKVTANDIAIILDGKIVGNPDKAVSSPSGIEDASEDQITFLGNPKYEKYLVETNAGIIIVPSSITLNNQIKSTLILVEDVYLALAKLFQAFEGGQSMEPGISEKSNLEPGVLISNKAKIDAYVTVEEGAVIGDGVHIKSNVHIGKHVIIGEGSIIHSGARIMDRTEIGRNCIINPNAVIGSEGFGYAFDPKGYYVKIPHMGKVILQDNVEIGSNSTIDRGSMGNTLIMKGVKIDNLVHIAHNVTIGEHTAIAAQTGIAGSTKIGKYCRFGGQTGIVGHLNIADRTEVQAQSGIASSVKEEGSKLFGYPAINYMNYVKSFTVFKKLPELFKKIHRLEKLVDKLQSAKGE